MVCNFIASYCFVIDKVDMSHCYKVVQKDKTLGRDLFPPVLTHVRNRSKI